MPFIKRHLTSDELSLLDFAAYGVRERRIPPIEWDWAIDSKRAVMCTQLKSDTFEIGTIEKLASEAHSAVAHLGEKLVFTESGHFPRVP